MGDLQAIFQSTLSVRRATVFHVEVSVSVVISIHALRKESDERLIDLARGIDVISIHALRKESDCPATT